MGGTRIFSVSKDRLERDVGPDQTKFVDRADARDKAETKPTFLFPTQSVLLPSMKISESEIELRVVVAL